MDRMANELGQNNRRDYADNINTRGFQLYNADGFDPSTLVVGYWNNFINLKIHPAKEKSQRTDTSIYDYSKSISIVLSETAVYQLAHLIKSKIIPAIEAGKELTLTIMSGTNNGVIISSGVAIGGDTPKPYLAIVKGIDASTRIPESIIAYEFSQAPYLEGYSGKTEDKFVKHYELSELQFFANAMERASMDYIGSSVHIDKYSRRRFDSEFFKLMKALSANLNVEFYASNFNGGNRVAFTGNSKLSAGSTASQAPSAPIATTNLDNLANFG